MLSLGKVRPKVESWVVLRRAVAKDGTHAAHGAYVAHEAQVTPDAQPVARILWNGGQPERVQQIVRPDLRAWAVPGKSGAVLFWAV